MSRKFTVTRENVSITGAATHLALQGNGTNLTRLTRLTVTDVDATASSNQLQIEVHQLTVATLSGTGVTPMRADLGDGNFSGTCNGPATYTSTLDNVIMAWGVYPPAGLDVDVPGHPVVTGTAALGVKFVAPFPSTLTVTLIAEFEQEGA